MRRNAKGAVSFENEVHGRRQKGRHFANDILCGSHDTPKLEIQ